jgi:WD40 repeat protein
VVRRWHSGWRGVVAAFAVLAAVGLLFSAITILIPARPERTSTSDFGAVYAVASTQLDGRPVIISGSDDSTVRVWGLATGALLGHPLTGHTGAVYSVATAQLDDRTVIITGGDDATIRTGDLAPSVNSSNLQPASCPRAGPVPPGSCAAR